MRWQMGRRSDNIEDRRGVGMGGVAIGGGLGTVVLVLVAMLLGSTPRNIATRTRTTVPRPPPMATPPMPTPRRSSMLSLRLPICQRMAHASFPQASGLQASGLLASGRRAIRRRRRAPDRTRPPILHVHALAARARPQ